MDTNEVTTDVVEKSERACVEAYEKGDSVTTKYKAKLDTSRLATAESVKKDVCETNAKQCVDARPKGRFEGTTPEPRAGLACGCIPNSKNVPFPEVLDAETGKFKDAERLKQVFQESGMELDNQSKKIEATCGTGVTACILTLGMHEVGRDDVEVYDGSWCEWEVVGRACKNSSCLPRKNSRRNRTLLYNVENECSIRLSNYNVNSNLKSSIVFSNAAISCFCNSNFSLFCARIFSGTLSSYVSSLIVFSNFAFSSDTNFNFFSNDFVSFSASTWPFNSR